MKRLSRGISGIDGIELPRPETLGLPEKVVQFGTGAFLRGFVEYFIDEANRDGRFNGSIVAVSSTGSTRDATLNEQDGLFTLAIQGAEGRQYRVVSSLSRAISARDAWDAALELARSPDLELVISNTTEVGIVLDENDDFDARPPRSFPGKLTRFLFERARAFDYSAQRRLVVLPCELIDDNGTTLRDIVRTLAQRWQLGTRFDRWLAETVTFCNTLVDRIVPGVADATEVERFAATFGYRDDLLTACETYAQFAIQGDETLRARLGFAGDDPRIIVASDIRPYRERKLRVLNGAHTIVVPAALLAGLSTVREACEDERIGPFLRRVVFHEIVPSLDAPEAEEFARGVIERFSNPYVDHALIDITLHGTMKMRVRIVPSIVDSFDRAGRVPSSLSFGFAAFLAFMRGEFHAAREAAGLSMPLDVDGDRIREAWRSLDGNADQQIARLVRDICADAGLWGVDLTTRTGFTDAVAEHLVRIVRLGITVALDVHLTETANT